MFCGIPQHCTGYGIGGLRGSTIAHNMNTRQADPKFVDAITTNPDLETLFLNKELGGVSVSLKKH